LSSPASADNLHLSPVGQTIVFCGLPGGEAADYFTSTVIPL
jgi:hypothetical protein